MYLRYVMTSASDALVRSIRRTEALSWLRSEIDWEHRLARIRGEQLPCAPSEPAAEHRGGADSVEVA
jgi:hypothetical protein